MIGRMIKKRNGGFTNPMRGLKGSSFMMYIQQKLIISKQAIKNPFGIYNNSQKKMSVERRRKMVKKGVKIRFPNGDTIEIGNPQLIRIGNDISEIKS